jgi:cellulose synthase/poly-beta-1,6-N-acetylglucosamine synthase-like glycosyltransferase
MEHHQVCLPAEEPLKEPRILKRLSSLSTDHIPQVLSMIRVSTILPAYNSALTIAQALDSACAQTCKGQEIIVINDSSTDRTLVFSDVTAEQ